MNLLALFLKLFFNSQKTPLPEINRITNILIVRQHNQLGDMILSIPLFRVLKENIPNCKISLIVSPDNCEAVTNNEFIDELILLKKKSLFNIFNLIGFIKNLRKKKYDLGLVPVTVSISFTSCFLLRIANCDYRIGPRSLNGIIFPFSYFFNRAIDFNWQNFIGLHVSEIILKIVQDFNLKINNLKSSISIAQSNLDFAQKFLHGSKTPIIGIHFGAGKVLNRWSFENFMQLCNKLISEFEPTLYFTIGDWELENIHTIEKELNYPFLTLVNEKVQNIAAIISKSNLFISNDTGIMHIAGTTNTPLICLFGPTDPSVWAPIGKNVHIIKNDSDINSISIESVFEKSKEILIGKE